MKYQCIICKVVFDESEIVIRPVDYGGFAGLCHAPYCEKCFKKMQEKIKENQYQTERDIRVSEEKKRLAEEKKKKKWWKRKLQ